MEHTTKDMSTEAVSVLDHVNYPSLRYLRQQTANAMSGVFPPPPLPRVQPNPGANRMRVPESDEKVVKVRPPSRGRFSEGLPDVGAGMEGGQAGRQKNGDLANVPMFGRDGLKRPGDPFDDP